MPFSNYLPMIIGSVAIIALLLIVARMAWVIETRLRETDREVRSVIIEAGQSKPWRQREKSMKESRERWDQIIKYRRTWSFAVFGCVGVVALDALLVVLTNVHQMWLALPLLLLIAGGVIYAARVLLRPTEFPPFPGMEEVK